MGKGDFYSLRDQDKMFVRVKTMPDISVISSYFR